MRRSTSAGLRPGKCRSMSHASTSSRSASAIAASGRWAGEHLVAALGEERRECLGEHEVVITNNELHVGGSLVSSDLGPARRGKQPQTLPAWGSSQE